MPHITTVTTFGTGQVCQIGHICLWVFVDLKCTFRTFGMKERNKWRLRTEVCWADFRLSAVKARCGLHGIWCFTIVKVRHILIPAVDLSLLKGRIYTCREVSKPHSRGSVLQPLGGGSIDAKLSCKTTDCSPPGSSIHGVFMTLKKRKKQTTQKVVRSGMGRRILARVRQYW